MDPNIQKIIQANQMELDRGDIKRTVMQVQDYLLHLSQSKEVLQEELQIVVEQLQKKYEVK